MQRLKIWLVLAVLLALVTQASALEAKTLTVVADDTVDSSFDVGVSINPLVGFRGLEFVVNFNPSVIEITGVDATGIIESSTISINEDNKVVVYTASPIDVSGGIIVMHFITKGSAGGVSAIALTEAIISTGTSTASRPDTAGVSVTLSECADHPNTHTGPGSGIPGTSCACNPGTALEINPNTQGWSCEADAASNLFGQNAQDCSLGGDPIYSTGYCCKIRYQLNQTFNNYNDLLGNPSEACTLIPNDPPTAAIFNPPKNATVGNIVTFSSRGSSDLDGEVVAYDWDFGDSSIHSNKENASHIYTALDACPASTCTVTLLVRDDDGGSDSTTTTLTILPGATRTPVCGNDLVETGEVCDGNDTAACKTGETCKSDCSVCVAPPPPRMEKGKTYTIDQLTQLGLNIGKDNTLTDGRVVTVSALVTITDIRPKASPPVGAVCGNNKCETGESATSCLADCHVGDGVCQKNLGENPTNAPSDCKKSNLPMILILLAFATIGSVSFLAIKKGWINRIGPFGHPAAGGPSGGPQFDLGRLAEQHEVATPHKDLSKLTAYIDSAKGQGFSYSQIRNTLQKKGWKENDINAAFK